MKISGLSALVTGGASGLGEACVRLLVDKGARVAILDVQEEQAQKLTSEFGDKVVFCKTDVTDVQSCEDAVSKTVEALNGVHIAINCAGIAFPEKVMGKKGKISMDQFNKVIQVNLIGTMNIIRAVVDRMNQNTPNEDGERGVVINTASAAAFEGQIGQASYSASKGGVVSMTLPIAREFADLGIRVVTIAPGLFETPMLAGLPDKARAALVEMLPFPKRLGKPDEYAMLAQQIIENPILNGETIRLDSAIRMAAK